MAISKLVYMRAEQIARMIVQGYGPTRVARLMGLSYEGLNRIRNTPEYQEIEESVQRTVLAKMDAVLDRRTDVRKAREEMQDEMEDAVPKGCTS